MRTQVALPAMLEFAFKTRDGMVSYVVFTVSTQVEMHVTRGTTRTEAFSHRERK